MKVVLGANHQFLYPQAMTNAQAHTQTLRSMAQIRSLAALDCWLWPERQRSSEEKRILRDSGKWINYNIGDRPMDEPCFPASPDPNRRMRALDLLRREVEFAMEAGARKIVLGSGPDVPAGREAAKERLSEVLLRLGAEIPPQVTLTLEPTDREIDKRFLFGPVEETVAFVHQLQAAGLTNLGVLLDMGHVPLMGETLESAVTHAGDTLRHIHLGNCILKNPRNPLYGDKHVAWGAAESEYGEEDAVRFIHLLQAAGYFQGEDCTVSFEMRPIEGLGPEESLARFIAVWEKSRPAELASQ